MYTLLYLHGFLSSPDSFKASKTVQWMQTHRPHIALSAPALSSYPLQAQRQLETLCHTLKQPVYAIGSSLGGFWATHLLERGLIQKAVLVNPAVSPHTRFRSLINTPLTSYSGAPTTYILGEQDLIDLEQADTPIICHKKNYWLMVQTGDETLNYRDAVTRYSGCKQLIEQGGNHAFTTYEKWLPDIIEALEAGTFDKMTDTE